MSAVEFVIKKEPHSPTPVDFSFKQLSNEEDILKEKPRTNRLGTAPDTGPGNKFVTSSVWLNNNHIETTAAASAMVTSVVEVPLQLAWLDLSFNQIYDIDDSLLQFPNLKIVYLHGNQVQNVSSVSMLQGLQGLRTLTLHGNPLTTIPHYRSCIVHMLPAVTNLDFSPIMESERRDSPPPGHSSPLKSNKKKPQK